MSEWHVQVSELLDYRWLWKRYSDLGLRRAADFSWPLVAKRYLEAATK
jgi:hypothetical protein